MSDLTLTIDRVVVETELEREAAAQIPEVLREAFQRLAERWARSPWARSISLATAIRRHLEVEPVSADELLGPRGAERLADKLWQAAIACVVEAA